MLRTVEYYIKSIHYNGVERYLYGFDFENTSDVEWNTNLKYAFSFPTFKAALALKTYIEETNCDYPDLIVVKMTTIIEDVEGEE